MTNVFKKRMKTLNANKLAKLFLVSTFISNNVLAGAANPDRIHAAVVTDLKTSQEIASVVSGAFRNDEIDAKQIVQLNQKYKTAFLAPSTNFEARSSGCYLTVLDSRKNIKERILLQRSQDALTCEVILAVFACNSSTSGIGVIYGLRLGANHYYTEATFLELHFDGRLIENKDLSQKIGKIDAAPEAKRMLGCK